MSAGALPVRARKVPLFASNEVEGGTTRHSLDVKVMMSESLESKDSGKK